MPKCLIIEDEINQEECSLIISESYKEKNGKELPKKCKRVIGWKLICKACKNHENPNLKKKKKS